MAVLDEVLPVYRHLERHHRTVAAPPAEVWKALLAVSAKELPLSRLLMGVRSIPRVFLGKPLRAAEGKRPSSVVDEFMRSGFRALRVDPGRLLVAGAAMQPWRLVDGDVDDVHDLAGFRVFNRPGFVLIAVSFELDPDVGGTRIATETRVQPTDARAARAFLPYWLVIRAGSGLIRRDLLRAVARRAESTANQLA